MKRKGMIYCILGIGISVALIGCGKISKESSLKEKAEVTKLQTTLAEVKPKYNPGTYTSKLKLNNATLELEVVVDQEHVSSVRFLDLTKEKEEKYPLLDSCLEEIASQLYLGLPIENVLLSEDNKNTSIKILDTISQTLEQAH